MALGEAAGKVRPRRAGAPTVPTSRQPGGQQRLADVLSIAEQQGLLRGGRTMTVRGRMPSALVEQAKRKTGIDSDSKLLEMALASIVVADDYGEWLVSQAGSVSKDLNLEF